MRKLIAPGLVLVACIAPLLAQKASIKKLGLACSTGAISFQGLPTLGKNFTLVYPGPNTHYVNVRWRGKSRWTVSGNTFVSSVAWTLPNDVRLLGTKFYAVGLSRLDKHPLASTWYW